MFIPALIKQMNFIGGGDGNGGIDWYIWNCYSYDALVVSFEIFDLCFWKEAHMKYEYIIQNLKVEENDHFFDSSMKSENDELE